MKKDINKRTPKQSKLLELLKQNSKIVGKRKSLKALLLEAGYSLSMANQPCNVLKSKTIQQGMAEYLNILDDKRKQAITHITDKKLKQSKALDLAKINDILTRNHQLLGGNATERVEISDKEREEVDKAFADNSK